MPNLCDPSSPFERWIVLDTAALIAGTDNLYALGGLTNSNKLKHPPKLSSIETVKFFVTPDVACETRDVNARNRLQSLERLGCIEARVPSAEAVAEVARYAKLTGDYSVLSMADLRVLALTYMLEVERNGLEFLKEISEDQVIGEITSASTFTFEEVDKWEKEERERKEREELDPDGWTAVPSKRNLQKRPKKKKGKKAKKKDMAQSLNLEEKQRGAISDTHQQAENGEMGRNSVPLANVVSDVTQAPDTGHAGIPENLSSDDQREKGNKSCVNVKTTAGLLNSLELSCDAVCEGKVDPVERRFSNGEETSPNQCLGSGGDGDPSAPEYIAAEYLSEEDDGIGWINEDNLEEHLARDGGEENVTEEDRRRVACVTTDFAMQNTMLQMGLKLLSIDGRRTIRQIKRFALRCQSCSAITRELHRKFCERCGNATLHRVTFKVNKNGVARVYLNPKKTPTLRGTKYPIPLPRGGRHNKDLILCEDQIDPVQQRRVEKQRQRFNVDVLDPGSFYNAGARFNPHGRPLVVGYGKRNPNQVRPSSKSKR